MSKGTSNSDESNRIELEVLGVNQHKLSGTSLILRDINKKFVYKIIPCYTATEAIFYSIAHSISTHSLVDLKGNDISRESFNNLAYLVENKLIPHFSGLVSVCYSRNPDTGNPWYELQSNTIQSEYIYKAIKLENLAFGYKTPAFIDIKLGAHNVNYNVNYGNLNEQDKIRCIRQWRILKHRYRHSINNLAPMTKRDFDISASDLGLSEPFDDLDPSSLHTLLKTWRQKQVASETTELKLGFRISSIYCPNSVPSYVISSAEAKKLTDEEALNIIRSIFVGRSVLQRRVLEKLQLLRNWISLQKSISVVASSILITFEQNDDSLCKVRWVDFTHINANKSIVFANSEKSNMICGIDTLMNIIKKIQP